MECSLWWQSLIHKALGLLKYSTYATYLCNLLWCAYGILNMLILEAIFFFFIKEPFWTNSSDFEPIHLKEWKERLQLNKLHFDISLNIFTDDFFADDFAVQGFFLPKIIDVA